MSDRIVTVKRRAHGLYGGMVKRFAAKHWKSGKRQGQLRVPQVEIPFSEADLLEWLAEYFPFECALPCRYCSTPIDALSCSLDHATPVSRGGGIGLDNLDAICETCNRLKGSMNPREFGGLMAWLLEQHPACQQDVVGRLKAGAMGMRLRFYGRKR